ncbi:MAG: hypothetical protein ACYTFI_28240, partial [Planctomycetota bacterium]
MSKHWPLGKGRYAWSVAGTAIPAGVAVAVLGPGDPILAATVRLWVLLLFSVAALELPVLLAFRPGLLRLLLPAPLDEAGLYEKLGADRNLGVRVLPYAAGLIAMFPLVREEGFTWTVVSVFYACMLLRFLVPLLSLAAIRLRKLLVPFGFLLVWLVGVPAIRAIFTARPNVWTGLSDWLYLLPVETRDLRLVAGVALAFLAGPVRAWCRRAAVASLRRDGLLDYAFPVASVKRFRPRKMLIERLRVGARFRRFVFLIQEATGLYRAADWCKAAGIWIVAFGGLLYAFRSTSGTAAHIGLTAIPIVAVSVWLGLRRLRWKGDGFESRPQHNDFALPVGHIEMSAAAVLGFTILLFATGVAAAVGLELAASLCAAAGAETSHIAQPAGVVFRSVATNICHAVLLVGIIVFSPGARPLRSRKGSAVHPLVVLGFKAVTVVLASFASAGVFMAASLKPTWWIEVLPVGG